MRHILISFLILVFTMAVTADSIQKLEEKLENASGEAKARILVDLIEKYLDSDVRKSIQYSNQSFELISEIKDPVLKIRVYNWRAAVLRFKNNPKQAIVFAEKSLEIAKKIGNKDLESQSLAQIGRAYDGQNQFKKGLKILKNALELSREAKKRLLEGKILIYIGTNHNSQSEFSQARSYFEKAAAIFKELQDRKWEAQAFSMIGSVHNAVSNYSMALEYMLKALKYYEKSSNRRTYGSLLNDIGILYHNLGNTKKSLELYLQAKKIAEAEDDQNLVNVLLNNLGTIYQEMGDYQKSLQYLNEALQNGRKRKNKLGVAIDLYNIGSVYMDMNRLNESETHLRESLQISQEIKDNTGIAMSLLMLSQIQKMSNSFDEALVLIRKAEAMVNTIDSKELKRSVYEEYSYLYSSLRNYPKASEFYRKADKLRKSIHNNKSAKRIAEMRTQYQTEKKEREIENLKHQQTVKNLQLRKKDFQRNIVIAGLMIGVLIIILLYRQSRMKSSANRLIQSKNLELQKAYEKLEQVAATDPLTKLSNRRDVMKKISYELDRFKRYKRVFAVIIGDLDDFKSINDNSGHDAGDFILVSISDIMRSSVRKQDTVSRWGGEEFLIFMPETDLKGGIVLAEKIRKKIMNHPFTFKENTFNVTITFGVGEFREGMDIDQCIKFADQALYEGKRGGKNRVVPFEYMASETETE